MGSPWIQPDGCSSPIARTIASRFSTRTASSWRNGISSAGRAASSSQERHHLCADSQSTDKINPGYQQGIRVGSVKDGKVAAYIRRPELGSLEGVASDDAGNVYGGYTGSMNLRRWVKK